MATPPASWELATPVFGIRYPRATAPARYLPDAFGHIGTDLENALLSGPIPPGLNYKTGTRAERLAATPIRDQVWVETDTGNQYIGTGTAWVAISITGAFMSVSQSAAQAGFGQAYLPIPFDTIVNAVGQGLSFSTADRGIVVANDGVYSLSTAVSMTAGGYAVRISRKSDGAVYAIGEGSANRYTTATAATVFLSAGSVIQSQLFYFAGSGNTPANNPLLTPVTLNVARLPIG